MARVSDHVKLVEIIRYLLMKAPANINDIADYIARKLNIKFTTARTATIRLLNQLINDGIIDIVGMDKRMAKLYDFTPKGLAKLIVLYQLDDPELYDTIIKRIGEYNEKLQSMLKEYLSLLKKCEEKRTQILKVIP